MRAIRILATGALALAAAFVAPAGAQDFDAVEIRATDLGSGVHMLVGRGGNLGVSTGPDGVLLIDDQYAPLTPKIREAVRGLGGGAIRYVLNTHWHGDHTGGNENLGKAGAVIVAHHQVRERMSTAQLIEAFDRRVPPSPPAALPVLTFGDDVTFHLNGDTIRVFHVDPAHTDGDSVVHFEKADVVHMGDTYFAGRYPFVDLSSGGSVDGVIAAAERILELAGEKTRIIPGHGPLSNRAELADYRDMLAAVRLSVATAIGDGKTVEQVVASRPTAALDAEWGGGFVKPDDFVRTVYASLAGE